MFNSHLSKQLDKPLETPETLKKATKKLKKIFTERKSKQRIEAYVDRLKGLDSSHLSEMFRGHYVSGNPNLHKHRDHDPLLPSFVSVKE